MEKWPSLGLEQEIYKRNLEPFVPPESKEVLQRNRGDVRQRDTAANGIRFQWPKLSNLSKANKKALHHYPRCKQLSPQT